MRDEIHISSRQLNVRILPQYGAMVSGILFKGREVLYMEENYLGKRNARAGGIPVLFPFAGRTKDDSYLVGGRKYSMPLHGFLKDQSFKPLSLDEKSCELTVCGNEEIYGTYFPFPYQVKIRYTVDESVLLTELTVLNLGCQDFGCAIGFHPYFAVLDKTQLKLDFGMREYWDYTKGGRHGIMHEAPDPARKMDHVFRGFPAQGIVLQNPPEGYAVRLMADDSFDVTTINTRFCGVCCIEPWQGLPNAANSGQGVQIIEAGGCRSFQYRLIFEDCTD